MSWAVVLSHHHASHHKFSQAMWVLPPSKTRSQSTSVVKVLWDFLSLPPSWLAVTSLSSALPLPDLGQKLPTEQEEDVICPALTREGNSRGL